MLIDTIQLRPWNTNMDGFLRNIQPEIEDLLHLFSVVV